VTLPLEDLRVVAIEQYGAGPFSTLQLADLGADVIRVEDPVTDGDSARSVPPYAADGTSLFFESFNRNKRSVSLDLRTAAGRSVLEDLVRQSDALVFNLRGDQPAKLRLRYADLCGVNPSIVCVSLSAFGMSGPRSAQGGYDFTVQGITGWMELTGGPDQPATKSGLPLVDFATGYVAALALVTAVWHARRTGKGCDADISLFDTALAQLAYVGTWVATHGFSPPRLPDSAHLSMVPFQTFPTMDGRIVIACPKDNLWRRLCIAIDRPGLHADPRFSSFESRFEHRDALVEEVASRLKQKTTAHWLDVFETSGVPCGAVNDVAAALSDPQADARGAIVQYEHPILGVVRTVRTPLRLGLDEDLPLTRSPMLGEHTTEVLKDVLGYEPEIIRSHAEAGAFGRDGAHV
jgi:crotonobetainyl-CoA:carnitine CoA-transferase CaiB-like acyl-CoA transferase